MELALEVLEINTQIPEPRFTENRSKEYWAGWALAYYQWYTALSFEQITSVVPIAEICGMYYPYHEMDITQFCDRMDRFMDERRTETNLRRIRMAVGLSQSQLAERSKFRCVQFSNMNNGRKT